MSPSRRDRGSGRRRGGRPERYDRGQGGGQPGRYERGQPIPQFSEELARQAAKTAVRDILKNEPPENTIGRLRAMGLNNKVAAMIYSHARDQVRIARRRVVAILMVAGTLLVLLGTIIAAIQNWPGTGKPWHLPWVGLIFAAVGAILMIWSYVRWRRMIRS